MTELVAPCTIACDAVPDPAVFWAMVEAIGTWVAAILAGLVVIVIIYEARSFRREQAAHTAAGIDWLFQFMNRDDVLKVVSNFNTFVANWNTGAAIGNLGSVLAPVDIVVELIDEGFVSARMLLLVTGGRYTTVNNNIGKLLDDAKTREGTRGVLSMRLRAYELVREVSALMDDILIEAETWRAKTS